LKLGKNMKNLIKKFQNTSHQYNLWKKRDKIVVACSGGPDSTCLLDIFDRLAPKYELELIVAHVNHGLRGKDSEKDAEFVRKLAGRHSLKYVEIKPKLKKKGNLENQLREIRYDFFEKIRTKNNFDYIAVGHTLNDQAETYLMRIIRGAGLAGLSAMKNKTGCIIRPLLGITKKEILEYLCQTNQAYRIDRTNKEVPYLRNKIRQELIPLLEKKYNPNIKKVLYESSLTVADDYDLINTLVDKYQSNANLSVKKILKLHPALQKRVIFKAIESVRLDLKDIEDLKK